MFFVFIKSDVFGCVMVFNELNRLIQDAFISKIDDKIDER